MTTTPSSAVIPGEKSWAMKPRGSHHFHGVPCPFFLYTVFDFLVLGSELLIHIDSPCLDGSVLKITTNLFPFVCPLLPDSRSLMVTIQKEFI